MCIMCIDTVYRLLNTCVTISSRYWSAAGVGAGLLPISVSEVIRGQGSQAELNKVGAYTRKTVLRDLSKRVWYRVTVPAQIIATACDSVTKSRELATVTDLLDPRDKATVRFPSTAPITPASLEIYWVA